MFYILTFQLQHIFFILQAFFVKMAKQTRKIKILNKKTFHFIKKASIRFNHTQGGYWCVGCNDRETAEKMGVRFLGEIPLHIDIRTHADEGKPIVEDKPDSPQSLAYMEIARKINI